MKKEKQNPNSSALWLIILLTAFIAITCASCHKKEIKPAPAPPKTEVYLNYRVTGFKSNKPGGDTILVKSGDNSDIPVYGVAVLDSFAIYINDVIVSRHAYGYHMAANKGDIVKFYAKGQASDTTCSFFIWPDRNEQPDIKYFKAVNGIAAGSYTVY